MSELAFNINGEAFEVPPQATGWRVRRMRAKGSPEVVYGREGTPLVLPIDAEIDDLRTEVDVTGRYRLDLVDQHNKAIPDVPSGYVQVQPQTAPSSTSVVAPSAVAPSDNIVIEAMRMNSEIAKSVVDRFPMMMEAAAMLLRAADGAGLPARQPAAQADGDDDDDGEDADDEPGAPAGFDLNAIVAQMVPVIVAGFASGKLKVPGLASLFDWRKAVPAKEPTAAAGLAPAHAEPAGENRKVRTPPTTPAPDSEAPGLPTIDPVAMAHVIAIQSALSAPEVAFVQEVAKELSPAELRAWFDKLGALSVPEAIETIRGLIAGKTKTGGAS